MCNYRKKRLTILIKCYSSNNRFLAKGYYGKQNKGYGCIDQKRK
ncbi:hypothetical protein [Peribacillus simplex]